MEQIKYYTLKEVAEITRIKENTLRINIRAGKLTAVKFGRQWLISEEDLKKYLTPTSK